MNKCWVPESCKNVDCIECNKLNPGKADIVKELMVCTCGNSKNEIYAEIIGMKITKIFFRCPKCKKESLIAQLDGDLRK